MNGWKVSLYHYARARDRTRHVVITPSHFCQYLESVRTRSPRMHSATTEQMLETHQQSGFTSGWSTIDAIEAVHRTLVTPQDWQDT